jgi:hypothetical protein
VGQISLRPWRRRGSAAQQAGRYALAADDLVLVVLAREHHQRRLNDASAETKNQVQRRLCAVDRSTSDRREERVGDAVSRTLLDVVVGQRAAVLQLLAGEDEALLVGRDAWSSEAKDPLRAASARHRLQP